jgi:PAS domain S-box-containing protein
LRGRSVRTEALKLGATDYVFKTRLSRIVPSVQRALRETQQRTQREQAEAALDRNRAFLAEAQRLSHTGSFGWRPSSGEIYWSEETFRIFEVDLATKPSLELVMQRAHPEDRELLQKVVASASTSAREFDFEHRLLMEDGSVKYLEVVGHPMRTESGEVEFVGAVTDITDRKEAERELQQLVDLVPQVIAVLSPDGKWIHANRVMREYTGLTPDEYLSDTAMLKVVHPDDVPVLIESREHALREGKPFELEARLRGEDGVHRWFLLRYNPLVEGGAVRRWYATATEIESRKQEEERVRKENVRLEERTRIARELHDTLLQTYIGASLQLSSAMDSLPPDLSAMPRLTRALETIERGIQEGRNAIYGLRSAEDNTAELVPALSRIAEEHEALGETEFEVKVVGQEQDLFPEIQHEVYRIGGEALSNAFSHSGGNRVSLEIEYSDLGLRMRIRDNGRGIDHERLEQGREGHWGLAGMRERAARIGGELQISSHSGAGTQVELTIPHRIAFPRR